MKWRLFLGLILCGVCFACVATKAPSQYIVPPAPALARSTAPPPSDHSGQPDQEIEFSKTLQETVGTETASAERGNAESVEVMTPEKAPPKNRLLGCSSVACANDDGTAKGSARYVEYKWTGYIGSLPIRTAFFTVKCANGVPGEELFFFKEEWCFVSGAGLNYNCYDKQYAMKMACTGAESLGLE